MTFTITRQHAIIALAVVVIGVGAFVGVRAIGKTAPASRTALPAVMQCSGKVQSKPQRYTLACAYSYSTELVNTHWTLWTPQAAIATATLSTSGSNCVPDCADGEIVTNSYPATVRLSSPRSVKAGLLFTRVVMTYRSSTGKRVTLAEDLITSPPSAAPVTTTPAAVGSGYLFSVPNGAWFIQWQTNGTAISGTIQIDYLSGTAPNENLSTNTDSVAGRINGSQISLSINGQADEFGTISNGSFTLDVPQSNGTLAPAVFSSAAATQFNQAVAGLNATVTSANNAANQAAAAANHASAVAQAEQQLQNDVSTIESDISGMSSDAGAFSGDLSQIKQDAATTGKDLATTQSAAASVKAEAKQYPGGNSGETCSDASNVAGDASNVAGDASNVAGDASNVEGDISTVQNDESTLQSDNQQYLNDLGAVPGYSVSGAPSQSSVNAALKSASGAISSAIVSSNQFIATANADVTAAYAAANSASQAGNCGAGESAPSPETTIPS